MIYSNIPNAVIDLLTLGHARWPIRTRIVHNIPQSLNASIFFLKFVL